MKDGKTELDSWVRGWLSKELRVPENQISREKTFVAYGMDSVHAMMLVGDLEDRLGRRLPPTLAWDHPTVDALVAHLSESSPAAPEASDAQLLERLDDLSEAEIDQLLAQRLGGAATI